MSLRTFRKPHGQSTRQTTQASRQQPTPTWNHVSKPSWRSSDRTSQKFKASTSAAPAEEAQGIKRINLEESRGWLLTNNTNSSKVLWRETTFSRQLYGQKHCQLGLRGVAISQKEKRLQIPNFYRQEAGCNNYSAAKLGQRTWKRKDDSEDRTKSLESGARSPEESLPGFDS